MEHSIETMSVSNPECGRESAQAPSALLKPKHLGTIMATKDKSLIADSRNLSDIARLSNKKELIRFDIVNDAGARHLRKRRPDWPRGGGLDISAEGFVLLSRETCHFDPLFNGRRRTVSIEQAWLKLRTTVRIESVQRGPTAEMARAAERADG